MLANRLGKLLHEVMGWDGPMTDRQFRVWTAWVDLQWNKPSLTDHYLMEVGAEVRRGWVKDPHKVKIEDMKLTFHDANHASRPDANRKRATIDQRILASQVAKARWQAMMGAPVASTPPTIGGGYTTPIGSEYTTPAKLTPTQPDDQAT